MPSGMPLARVPLELRLGELFCGPGGIGLGAAGVAVPTSGGFARYTHSFATDIDADTCRTYERNFPEAKVLNADVRGLDLAGLPPVDVLAFGFPCNDFSVVGERKGIEGHFGALYSYGVRYLEIHRPLAFVAENVGGLASADEGRTFRRILCDLETAGYAVTSHLYKAEEYGVPQRRRRILVVGIRRDLGQVFVPPGPTTAERPPTVGDVLRDLPFPEGVANHERTRQSATVVARLEHIKPGENAFNAELPPELRLNVRGAKISQIYRRLDPAQPSYTVTGSGGGGTHIYHWEEPRALTNRERARLQGFPDDFAFCGSKESVRGQIGMAVPPPLARAVLAALAERLHAPADAPLDVARVPSQRGGQYLFAMEPSVAYAE